MDGAAVGIQPRVFRRHTVGSAYGSAVARHARASTPTVDLLAAIAEWEEQGVWLRAWRKLLVGWISASCWIGKKPFWTPPLSRQKRGLGGRKDPSRERYEVHGGGRRPGHTYRSATCVRANLRVPACGKHARAGESATSRPRTSALPSAACNCRSRLRFGRVTPTFATARDGVDRPLSAGTAANADFEDKRKLRRYRRRWKIERTNAWLQNFRRIQVRYDRILSVFQGFFHCACLIITLRHLCN